MENRVEVSAVEGTIDPLPCNWESICSSGFDRLCEFGAGARTRWFCATIRVYVSLATKGSP